MKRFLYLILALFMACQSMDNAPSSQKPMPIDPAVTIGTLDNGLTYYLRENSKPENRTELWLAVKTGSIREQDDQAGLAHLLEHMAFNGTEKYPEHDIIDYLESIGIQFGPEINAYTSFDQTVYMLQVPMDDPEKLDKGLDILSQWAFSMKLDPVEVDKERGVVIEEWRLGRGANQRMLDKHLPILLKDSRYARRLPIGDPAIIESFEQERIESFYADWYRPDLMAVIAVGDFETPDVEGLIKKYFSMAKGPENPKELITYPVPGHKETLYSIATDPEAQYITFELYMKYNEFEEYNLETYYKRLKNSLILEMFNQRLNEKVNEPDSPLVYAEAVDSRFTKVMRAMGLFWVAKPSRETESAAIVFQELERIQRFGFNQGELTRAKAEMMSIFKNAYNERNTTDTKRFMQKYLDNFLLGVEIPGIDWKYELIQEFLPALTLEEIQEESFNLFTGENQVVMVSAPDQVKDTLPTEEQLKKLRLEAKEKELEMVKDDFSDAPLVSKIPEGSKVKEEKYIPEIDVTEWILDNGVKVVLKPTEFKSDEILFSAYSPGGVSQVEDKDFLSSLFAVEAVRQGGLGDFSMLELEKKMAGKQVYVEPFISTIIEGFQGRSTPGDLETAFQLIYLYFTGIKKYPEGINNYVQQVKSILMNRVNDPEAYFNDTINYQLYREHFRARPVTSELLEEVDTDRSFEIYKERFVDGEDFTFVFTGNFTVEKIKPFVETYLGAIPSIDREETWLDRGERLMTGVMEKDLKMGSEPKSYVSYVFPGEYEWDPETNYLMESLEFILDLNLWEIIREDESGTYGVRVGISKIRYPESQYSLKFSFGCSPERAEELAAKAIEVLEKIKTEIPEETMIKTRETQKQEYKKFLKENNFWLASLQELYFHGANPLEILEYEEDINNLTAEDIQALAKKIINNDRYLKVILYPQDQE